MTSIKRANNSYSLRMGIHVMHTIRKRWNAVECKMEMVHLMNAHFSYWRVPPITWFMAIVRVIVCMRNRLGTKSLASQIATTFPHVSNIVSTPNSPQHIDKASEQTNNIYQAPSHAVVEQSPINSKQRCIVNVFIALYAAILFSTMQPGATVSVCVRVCLIVAHNQVSHNAFEHNILNAKIHMKYKRVSCILFQISERGFPSAMQEHQVCVNIYCII